MTEKLILKTEEELYEVHPEWRVDVYSKYISPNKPYWDFTLHDILYPKPKYECITKPITVEKGSTIIPVVNHTYKNLVRELFKPAIHINLKEIT